tara:strand:- start:20442 stop:20819 length:378 start_codon:yes stop_codon:yes gene_type:complete
MKTTLTPLVHNRLKDINAVQRLSSNDTACISEIKSVLKKYQNQNKFGITLLHKHFDISEDEIMVESIDVENRVLTTRPVKLKEAQKTSLVQTVWCFSNDPILNKNCESVCPTDKNGNHLGYRDHL